MQKLLQKINNYIKNNKALVFSLAFATLYSSFAFAAPWLTSDAILNPTCAPGAVDCYVTLHPDQTSNAGKFLTTNGTTTAWGSLPSGATIGIGDTLSNSPTTGSILFVGAFGVLQQDNASLFFDNTSNRLGIGDASPTAALTVGSGDLFQVNSSGTIAAATGITSSGTITLSGLATNGLVTNTSAGVLGTLAGTTTTVLHGNASGLPTYGAVSLTADVSDTLPVANGGTGITSFGSGIATWLSTPSSANLASVITNETGGGALVFASSPTITSLILSAGTATAGTAPLKLTAGTNLGTTEAGAIEYDGTHLYFTAANAGSRYQLDQQGGGGGGGTVTSVATGTGLSGGTITTTGTLTANLSTGISGGQSVIGGTLASNNLTLSSTAHATKGKILFGTSAYDEVNNRLGIGTATPSYALDVASDALVNGIRIGMGAGSISSNTAFGLTALNANTTGNNNVAIGSYSLISNTQGATNTAVGVSSLHDNTLGSDNTAVGNLALYTNIDGISNTATGKSSLFSNTTGDYNTANGVSSLNSTTGDSNTAMGVSSLNGNTSGSNNLALGFEAGSSNAGVYNNNIFMGYRAANNITTGADKNIVIGHDIDITTAGGDNQLNIGNIIFGTGVTGTGTTIAGSIGIGKNNPAFMLDVNGDASFNGVLVGRGGGNGSSNTAVGLNALVDNTSGIRNSVLGSNALSNNVDGSHNSAFGETSMFTNISGHYNSAYGFSSLYTNTASQNSAFGSYALTANTTGADNSSFGYESLRLNSDGATNSAFGTQSSYNNTSGANNSSLGYRSLFSNNTGSNNVAIGDSSGNGTTGVYNNNIFIGHQAANNITTGADNNIVIGYDIDLPTANGDNQMTIGNIIFGTGITGTGTTIAGAVGVGDATPDYRFDIDADIASYASGIFNDGNATTRSGLFIQGGLDDHTAAGPSTLIGFADGDGTAVGSITFGSSATAYNTTSDQRLKDLVNEKTISSLNILNQIKIHDYVWKDDLNKNLYTGVFAQELYNVYPHAVTKPVDENLNNWMVDYSKLTPIIVASIQDIDTKLVSMENLETDTTFVGNLRNWLASAANGIQKIFTKEIETENLCVSDTNGEKTCITKSQLDNLLLNEGQNNTSNTSNSSPSNTVEEPIVNTTTDTENAQNTDAIVEQTPPVVSDQTAIVSE